MTVRMPNWESTTSGRICEYITSGSRDWKSYYSDTGTLFIRTQDINRDRLDLSGVARVNLPEHVEGKRSRVQPGDLLITITGANVGKVALVPEGIPEAYVSQSVGLMRLKDKRVGPFLHYYLQSEEAGRRQVSSLVYGIGRPVLSLQNLRDIPVLLPPLPEQRKIVEEIEKQFTRLDAGVAALRRAQANLRRYRAAVLKAACEGRLVEREAPWRPSTLGKIALSVRNGYSHKPDGETGTRIFRISAVRKMRLDVDDVRYLSGKQSDYESFTVDSQDVLFTRYNGSRDFVGVCAVVPENLPTTVYPDKLIRVRLPPDVLLPKMLAILASAGSGRAFVESRIRTTAGQSGISGSDLKAVPLEIPSMSEQIRIVAEVERRLSVGQELDAAVSANVRRAARLRRSILDKAFHIGRPLE